MNWQSVLSVLAWFKSNYLTVVLVVVIALLPLTNWYTSTKSDAAGYQRAKLEDLAVKPDTVRIMVPANIPTPVSHKVKGTKTELTVKESQRIDSVVFAERDSLGEALKWSLMPWEYDVRDSTTVRVNGKRMTIPSLTHVEVNNIDHVVQAIVALLPFEIPVDVITREIPVNVPLSEKEKTVYRLEGVGLFSVFLGLVYLLVTYL
jgi:hypothetical protein